MGTTERVARARSCSRPSASSAASCSAGERVRARAVSRRHQRCRARRHSARSRPRCARSRERDCRPGPRPLGERQVPGGERVAAGAPGADPPDQGVALREGLVMLATHDGPRRPQRSNELVQVRAAQPQLTFDRSSRSGENTLASGRCGASVSRSTAPHRWTGAWALRARSRRRAMRAVAVTAAELHPRPSCAEPREGALVGGANVQAVQPKYSASSRLVVPAPLAPWTIVRPGPSSKASASKTEVTQRDALKPRICAHVFRRIGMTR